MAVAATAVTATVTVIPNTTIVVTIISGAPIVTTMGRATIAMTAADF